MRNRPLPGRSDKMPVPAEHFGHRGPPRASVSGRHRAFGLQHGMLLGRGAQVWERPGVYTTRVGYAGGVTPNPTYHEVCSGQTGPYRGGAGHLRSLPGQLRGSYSSCSGRTTTLHRGCARVTTPALSIARRCTTIRTRIRWLRKRHVTRISEFFQRLGTERSRQRSSRRRVLLCRGLPPAVSGKEPGRVLRDRRYRCLLPDWCSYLEAPSGPHQSARHFQDGPRRPAYAAAGLQPCGAGYRCPRRLRGRCRFL